MLAASIIRATALMMEADYGVTTHNTAIFTFVLFSLT
jgi:hypothetical protein